MIGLMERLRVRVMECLLGREINCLIVCLGVWVGPPVVLRNLSGLALWQRNAHCGTGSFLSNRRPAAGVSVSPVRVYARTGRAGWAKRVTPHPPAPARESA